MKITLERTAFLKALNHIQSVVERRNTIPILSKLLLQADGDQIRLTATDLDIEVVEIVQADVAKSGATTASAHMMHDIVRKLPDGSQIEIEQGPDESRVAIRARRSRFALQAMAPEDFPDLATGEFTNRFAISAMAFKTLIEKTRFAISTEETRYYLNGIYLHSVSEGEDAMLRAVATDGHRLARAQIGLPDGAKGMPGIIIPRKTVLEVSRLIEGDDTELVVEVSSSKIRFGFDGIVLTSKLIDGRFPDYEQVIPKENDKRLLVDTKLFAEAVDRVSTIASERGRAVRLDISKDQLRLSVNNPDSGLAEEDVPAQYDGETLDIGFNARYLLDMMSQFSGEKTQFMLAVSGSPTIVSDVSDDMVLYVIMPMRI